MSKHTSFRIGGPARLYVIAPSSDALVEAVRVAQEQHIPWYVFGGGSNLLVADQGYEGVVIQAANRGLAIDGERLRVESGVITVLAARKTVDAGLTGFEWAVGVPGTIGGAVYGNAGCYGGEMKDVITMVDAYRIKDGARVHLTNAECQYGYRDSVFKREPHVILGCELQLDIRHQTSDIRQLDQIMRARKESQPLDQSSAGCVFKNFESDDARARVSAGWLVEQAGMKGQRVGDIQVSEKHGNFFVNLGAARAQDVVALIALVKMKVRDKLGIELQEEIQFLA